MNFEVHYGKYLKFRASAEQDRYVPSRIEDYFKAAFHLIEAVAVRKLGLHIQKHQKIRAVLKQNRELFGNNTDAVIAEFHKIENEIRVATGYGKRENGELLENARRSFSQIESVCSGELPNDPK